MKKILMILLSIITIQMAGLLVFAEPQETMTATQSPAMMEVYHRISCITDGGHDYFFVDTRITNTGDSAKDVVVIFAAYSNDRLENVFCQNDTIASGGTKRFYSERFDNYSVDTIKTFVWDSFDSLEPLGDYAVTKLLDYEFALKIAQDYRPENTKPFIANYYGNYNGYEVFTISGIYDETAIREEIAGYNFVFPNTAKVYAYKDSQFYTIKEAYETGLLSKRDIYQIGRSGGYISQLTPYDN